MEVTVAFEDILLREIRIMQHRNKHGPSDSVKSGGGSAPTCLSVKTPRHFFKTMMTTPTFPLRMINFEQTKRTTGLCPFL
jgi:hypothetical protein